MRKSDYTKAKLAIYESASAGNISNLEKCQLFAALEAKKNDDDMSKDEAIDALKKIAGSFEDIEDDADKLIKKLEKMSDDDEGSDDEKDVEEAAYYEAMASLQNLANFADGFDY